VRRGTRRRDRRDERARVEALFGGRERAKRRWSDASRAMKTATRTTTGTTRATTRMGRRARRERGATRARAASGGVSKSSLDEGYNCVVREDGVMVAEGDIPSGTYQVSAWWAGARNDGKGNAPRCDSERQRGCEVRCELTGEGELVCEGIESGTYVVVNVADLDEACAVTFDGESIECEGAGEPLVSDTGDLDLKDSSQHGIRMGG
jgi:hypothetical protein